MVRAPSPGRQVVRYGLAVGLVSAATGLSFVIRPLTEGSPFILYFLAAILSARFGGLGSGLLATLLGGLAARYFFIAPHYLFGFPSAEVAFELVGFLLVGGIACWITSALGRAEERLRRVLDSIWEGFVVVDPHWRAVYVNRRVTDSMGKRPDEVIGKRVVDVFPELTTMPFFHELHQAMVERRPAHIEAYFPTRDVWLESNVVPAEKGLALFVRNVTDRKRVQQALESTLADLARSNQELERFASTVSHDWVQPLSSITNSAWLLEGQSKGEIQRYARDIIEVTKRMAALLQARRDDSKAGPRASDLESTELDGVLDQVRQALEGMLAGKGMSIASNGLPTVKADPLLMRQMLYSLVSSQIKAAAAGPSRLMFSARQDEHRWIVSLQTRGTLGTPAPDPANEQDDDFTISRRIVELHGGRLWSEQGADGAPAIHFALPTHPAPLVR
jgi:PAS domain S-box-containing protein